MGVATEWVRKSEAESCKVVEMEKTYPTPTATGLKPGSASWLFLGMQSERVVYPVVSEAVVVGYPHDIKGQGIYVCFKTLAEPRVVDDLVEGRMNH